MGYLLQVVIILFLNIITGKGDSTEEGLSFQNKLRKIHNAPGLKLNSDMSAEAEKYAATLADKDVIEHSRTKDGENLAMGCSEKDEMSYEDAIKMWYDEVCNPGYQFSNSDFSAATGHFTQVVWKGSKEFGIGKKTITKKNNRRCTFVVGRYRPAGNYKGQFGENVKKGSFEPKNCNALDSPIESQSGNEGDENDFSETPSNKDKNKENESSDDASNETSQDKDTEDIAGSEGTANEIGDAIAEEIDNSKKKPKKGSPISQMTINIAEATAIGANAGAKAGAEAGKKAGKKAAEDAYKNKSRQGRKRAETAVVRAKHRVNVGVSIVKETPLNPPSLLVNTTGERKNYTFYNTSDFIPIPAKIQGTNRTVINRTLVIPEEPRIFRNTDDRRNRTLNSTGEINNFNQNIDSPIVSNVSATPTNMTANPNGVNFAEENVKPPDIVNSADNQQLAPTDNQNNSLANNTGPPNELETNNVVQNTTNSDENSNDPTQTMFQNLTNTETLNQNQTAPSADTNVNEQLQSSQELENKASEFVDESLVNELATNATLENNELPNVPEFNAAPAVANQTKTDSQVVNNNTVYVDEPIQNVPQNTNNTINEISDHKPKKATSHHFTKLLKDSPIVRLDSKADSQTPLNVVFHNSSAVQFKNSTHASHSKFKMSNSNLSGVAPVDESVKRESQEASFEERGLKAHNIFRQVHDSKPMTLDQKLCDDAETYAKVLAEKGVLEHSKERNNAGENLAFGCSSEHKEMNAEEAVKNWYEEVCEPGYDFDAATFNGATGHFTQVVWDESTKLGIGRAMGEKNGMTCTYVVGRYMPAGNFMGKYEKNVKRGTFTPDDVCTKLDDMIANIANSSEQNEGGNSTDSSSEQNEGGNSTDSSSEQNEGGNSTDSASGDQANGNSSDKGDKDSNSKTSGKEDGNQNKGGGENGAVDGEVEIEEAALTIAREEAMKAAVTVGKKIGKEIGEAYYASQRDSIINSSKEEITPSAKEAVELTLNTFKKRAQRKVSAKLLNFLRRQVRVRKSSVTKKKKKEKRKRKKKTSSERKEVRKSQVITVQPIRKSHVVNIAPPVQANSSKKSNFQDIIKMGAKIGAIEGAKAGAIAGAKAAAEAISKGDPTGGLADILGDNKKGDKDNKKDDKKGGGAEQGGGDTDPANGETPGEEKPGKGPSGDTEPGPGEGAPVNPDAGIPIEAKNDTAGNNDESDNESNKNNDTTPTQADNKLGGDIYDSLQGAVRKAIDQGQKEGARVGAEAAIKSYGCVATKKNLIEILAHPNTRQLDNTFVTESISNYDPNLDSSDNDLHVDSPALQRKLGREGAVVGAVEGAMAAATSCVEAAGGSEVDKQQAATDGKESGNKFIESSENINEIVENAMEEANKKGACKPPKPKMNSQKMKPQKYHPPSHTSTFGKAQSADDFAKKGLEAHNVFREIHNAPPLKLNSELVRQAEEYAKQLADAGELKHQPAEDRNNNGENLAFACTSRKAGEMRAGQAVQNWYEEVCRPGYDFNTADIPQGGTLHFTQVVWRGTKQLGMGKAVSKKDGMTCTYVVARYKPAGNMGGQFHKNVEKGTFAEPMCNSLDEMIKGLDTNEQEKDSAGVVRNTTTDFDDNPDSESDIVTLIDNSHTIAHRKEAVSVKTGETVLHNLKPNKNLSQLISVIQENENSTLHYIDISPNENEIHVQGDRRNNASLPPKEEDNNNASILREANVTKRLNITGGISAGVVEEMKNITRTLLNQTAVREQEEQERLETFITQSLEAHNRYRQLHAVPQLTLDQQLTQQAQKYAEKLAKRGLLEHDKNLEDGENLAMKCIGPQETDPSGSFFTTLWYQEVCNPGFDFNNPKFSESTGHFTQIAWKNTERIGIGRAFKNENGIKCEYVVGRYQPAGNFLEEFAENIYRGNYDKSICENIVGSKKHATPRYTKHKSRAAKFRGLVL